MNINIIINILLIVSIIILSFILITYNSFIKAKNKINEAISGIDVLLKQRFDLIPNIIETVKGYSKYEGETLTELTEIRSNYEKSNSMKDADRLNHKINNIFAIAESYPDLKANGQFINLQNNLQEIETKLSYARNRYNSEVRIFNNKVESVPTDIIAKIFGFKKKEFFKLTNESEKENISVNI